MTVFAASSLILFVFSFVLSILISIFGKAKLNRIWALFNLSVAIWALFIFFASNTHNEGAAILYWKLAHIGGLFISIFFYHTICVFCDINRKKTILFAYSQGIFFLSLCFTDLFISSVSIAFNSFYYNNATVTYSIALTFWATFSILGLFELFRNYRTATGTNRNKIRYLFLGFLIGFLGGGTYFMPMYGLKVYPIGNFTIPVYSVIVTYAILRYRILDIRIAVTRTGLFLAVYTLVLGLPFALAARTKYLLIAAYGPNWWIIPLAAMAALATIGPFFYVHLQRKTEEALLKEQRRYQNTLKHAAIGMTRIRNLQKLLSLITHIVTKTVRIDYAAIYLYTAQTNEFTLQVFREGNRERRRVPPVKLSADSPLIRWLHLNKDPMIYDEIKRVLQDAPNPVGRKIEEQMRHILASVIIPSFLDQKLSGFIVLGDKMSGQIYTSDDLNVFQVLASQAALAIENAQFYEDAKEMQAQIAQAEKMATIGTMADGLSHQINNRFYALSLIAGDTIDTIKLTDTQKCSPEIQEMIKNINAALEKIQMNVTQGGEVVKGILKYTRKGDHKLDPIDLDQIIDATLEMVKYKVKLTELDIIREYPQETPKILGNLVQMQEVFFNFIDNAYDAIVERRNTLKEEGYRGRITISARRLEERLEITVRDNGMGVKKEDSRKLFTPFFTTKISARKGTGLGLYVIRNIITEHHGGRIAFDSTYKTGTSFILELPIAKAIT